MKPAEFPLMVQSVSAAVLDRIKRPAAGLTGFAAAKAAIRQVTVPPTADSPPPL